jgi:hypothetical protein
MPIQDKIHKHYWNDPKWWQDDDYVEFPVLTYKKHYSRTKTVERKIKSLIRRGKSFLLNTTSLGRTTTTEKTKNLNKKRY